MKILLPYCLFIYPNGWKSLQEIQEHITDEPKKDDEDDDGDDDDNDDGISEIKDESYKSNQPPPQTQPPPQSQPPAQTQQPDVETTDL